MTARKKTPAKAPANKKASEKAPEVKMVVPLSRGALQVLLSMIDSSTIQGKDMEMVMKAKMELIRVAGLRDGS